MEMCDGCKDAMEVAADSNKTAVQALTLVGEHGKQLDKLSDKIDLLRGSLEDNLVHAKGRDDRLDNITTMVRDIDKKIENGLRSEVQDTKKQVEIIMKCLERRKKERELEKEKGVAGYWRRGWLAFRDKSAFIVVTTTIIMSIYFFLWIIMKIELFNEGPGSILKLFGVG